jgi:hypothetical protein
LTLLAQRTGAAVVNAGRIDHAQTAIGKALPLLEVKRLSCWTAQRPIRLKRKVGSCEAPRFARRVALVGGAYPAAAGDTDGRVAACLLCGERAEANSVVRRGVGSSRCANARRRFHTHGEITCQHCCPQQE